MQITELYEQVRTRLGKLPGVLDAKAEADAMLRHRLGLSPTERLQHGRGEVGPAAADAVEQALSAREDGAPLAYALGRSDFAGHSFAVTPAVLIPRPETEWLVRRAEDYLLERRYGKRRAALKDGGGIGELALLDLGCGSGIIGITLAMRHPQLRVTLADVSPAALEVAELNAKRFGVHDRCEFREGDWFAWARRRERFDLILCNPPYVTRRDDPALEASVREHEPAIALFLDGDPEEFFYRLGRKAVSHLAPGALFAVEVGYDTAWPARTAFDRINALVRGKGIHDFSGIERVIWGIRR